MKPWIRFCICFVLVMACVVVRTDSQELKSGHKQVDAEFWRFSWHELETRRWQRADGKDVEMLEVARLHVDQKSDFLVLQYGNKADQRAVCVEFFRENTVGTNLANRFTFLGRDVDDLVVGRIAQTGTNGVCRVDIRRDGPQGPERGYAYFYDSTNGLQKSTFESVHLPP